MDKFSIIIPCRTVDKYVRECIEHCLSQSYDDFEILLLPDEMAKEKFAKTKIIVTGKVRPALKRNLAVKKSSGNILAFIDSDAYPDKDWLRNSLKYLKDEKVGAVGGPNLTPKENNLMQKAGGDVLASWLTGRSSMRYKIAKKTFTKELPSCNLIMRKDVFNKTDGFDASWLTAEDSKLCFQVWEELKIGVLYVPDVIVYHHRRALFYPHLRQMWIYARDIAWVIKRNFSFDKLYYFILSIFVIWLIAGFVLSFFNESLMAIYLFLVLIYLIITAMSSLMLNVNRSVLIFIGLVLTHIVYGLGFLYGFFSSAERYKKLNVR